MMTENAIPLVPHSFTHSIKRKRHMYKQGFYKETDRMIDLIADNYPMLLVTNRLGGLLQALDRDFGHVPA